MGRYPISAYSPTSFGILMSDHRWSKTNIEALHQYNTESFIKSQNNERQQTMREREAAVSPHDNDVTSGNVLTDDVRADPTVDTRPGHFS